MIGRILGYFTCKQIDCFPREFGLEIHSIRAAPFQKGLWNRLQAYTEKVL